MIAYNQPPINNSWHKSKRGMTAKTRHKPSLPAKHSTGKPRLESIADGGICISIDCPSAGPVAKTNGRSNRIMCPHNAIVTTSCYILPCIKNGRVNLPCCIVAFMAVGHFLFLRSTASSGWIQRSMAQGITGLVIYFYCLVTETAHTGSLYTPSLFSKRVKPAVVALKIKCATEQNTVNCPIGKPWHQTFSLCCIKLVRFVKGTI